MGQVKIRMSFTNVSGKKGRKQTHPSAKAPDHWRRKPRTADVRIAVELPKSHLKSRTPGGSNQGIRASKKNIVTGVVFHISLQFHIRNCNFSGGVLFD